MEFAKPKWECVRMPSCHALQSVSIHSVVVTGRVHTVQVHMVRVDMVEKVMGAMVGIEKVMEAMVGIVEVVEVMAGGKGMGAAEEGTEVAMVADEDMVVAMAADGEAMEAGIAVGEVMGVGTAVEEDMAMVGRDIVGIMVGPPLVSTSVPSLARPPAARDLPSVRLSTLLVRPELWLPSPCPEFLSIRSHRAIVLKCIVGSLAQLRKVLLWISALALNNVALFVCIL